MPRRYAPTLLCSKSVAAYFHEVFWNYCTVRCNICNSIRIAPCHSVLFLLVTLCEINRNIREQTVGFGFFKTIFVCIHYLSYRLRIHNFSEWYVVITILIVQVHVNFVQYVFMHHLWLAVCFVLSADLLKCRNLDGKHNYEHCPELGVTVHCSVIGQVGVNTSDPFTSLVARPTPCGLWN